MEDFHCDMLDLTFRFTAEDFDKDAFLKATNIEDESEYVDDEGEMFLSLAFSSREDPSKQHAHIRITIRQDNGGTASLNYHQTGTKIPDNKPPYLEDCSQWLSEFFKSEGMPATVAVAYDFNKNFTSTIPLPFPLVASDEALAGLKVTGLSFKYPEGALVDSVIIQREDEGMYLFFQKKSVVSLKEFDLFKKLEALAPTVNSLTKEQKKVNARNKQKTKAGKTS